MLVYRDAERPALVEAEAEALDRIFLDLAEGRGSPRELATEALIEAGALEAGVVDRLNPARDGFGPREAVWRAVTLGAGRLFRASRREPALVPERVPERVPELARSARRALEAARKAGAPQQVSMRTPEGYAWYALYPETYLEAARRFLASRAFPCSYEPGRAPTFLGWRASSSPNRTHFGGKRACADLPVTVIGLRGIGASLSAVVAAELEAAGREVDSLTLRPRGDPFDRAVRLNPALAAALARRVQAGGWFLIVDEGPGLSGSSFASVARALTELGAGDEQIVLMPSVATDGRDLGSQEARRRWSLHRKVNVGFDEMRAILVPHLEGARDLSGGLWRDVVCGPSRPPVAPQHERRKYLSRDGASLSKFAGLGRRGRERLKRAEALAAAGFAPEPEGLHDGFLTTAFLRGRPLRRDDPEALPRAAAYIGWLGRQARTGGAVQGDELFVMVERNVELALGADAKPRLDPWRRRLAGAPEVEVDGRMSPFEWLRVDEIVFKTDGVDHGDDHFLPGSTDIAWDVAGFATEWGLGEEACGDFAAKAARQAGDARLPDRLPFYQAAYLALRTGWTEIAASAMPAGADRRGLRRMHARYRAGLQRALQRLEAA